MIILSHTLFSVLLYRQNPGRFKLSTDREKDEHEEEINEDHQTVTLNLLYCNDPESLVSAVRDGIRSYVPHVTGCVLLLKDEETNKIYTFDGTGSKIWLQKIQTLWEVNQPKEGVRTTFKNLDHDIADQLRKACIAVSDHTPVLCSPVFDAKQNEVSAVLVVAADEFTQRSLQKLSWLQKQIAACYSHIQRTFSSSRGDEEKASQQLIRLCGELYDQDAAQLQLKVIKYLEEQTQAECAFILLVVPETQELFCQVIGKKVLDVEVRFPGHSSSFAVPLETKQPIHLDDIPQENLKGIEEVVERSIQSFLCVPIPSRSDNTLIALACLVNKTNANRFTERDISCIQQCFRYTATVLTSTIAFQNERRLKIQTQALLQVARHLFTNLDDLTKLLREIMQQARNLTHAERCSVFLIDKETDELVAKVFDGIQSNNDNEQTEIRMPITQGIAGQVATSGELLNIRDAYSHPLFYRGIDDTTGFKTRNILCFPIKDGKGTILGVAQLCNKKVGPYFTTFDEDVATAFGIYCCISINHSVMYKKVMDSQVRNTLANELMMYHMKVCPNDVQSLIHVDLPHPRMFDADFQLFTYAPRLLAEDRTMLATLSMFEDLGFISRWRIKRETLARFVLMVKKGYRNPPYHNWMHAYTVGQFCYQLIRNLRLEKYFDEIELFSLFVSCLCHDIDHRGTTNAFQLSSKSVLAALYSSEGSILERHHFAQTMCILNTECCNVFENLDSKEYQQILDLVRDNILATDLQHHFDILPALRNMAERGFDKMNVKNRKLLLCLLMTSCDLSDQTKPWENAKGVAAMIYKEFFSEGDMEKARGKRPPSSFDRERVEIPTHQISFIEKVAMPVYKVLADFFSPATQLVEAVEDNQAHWEKISNLIKLKKGGSCAKMTFEEVLAIENEPQGEREINHNELNSENGQTVNS